MVGRHQVGLRDSPAGLRHRVPSAATPRMAAADPADGQATAVNGAMPGNGLGGVLRATRREPALRQRPEQQALRRREQALVKAHPDRENVLRRIHDPLGCANNFAFRMVAKKSRSTSANGLPTIEGRATRTNSIGRGKSH